MSNDLFNDFEAVSAKQWKQKIQVDLKGADYNEKLVWNSNDGVAVKPFYHPDEVSQITSAPTPLKWKICEKIYVASAAKSNVKAKEALEKGAESLLMIISSEKIDPEILFSGINTEETPIFLKPEFLSEKYILKLKNHFSGENNKIFLQNDIVGNLARTGNWYFNLNQDHEIFSKIISSRNGFASIINIDAALYQNSGANIPQQLAYSLAHINEYFNYCNKDSVSEKDLPKITFTISVGSNYFFEIAKIRALRLLFSTLAKEYDLPEECTILVTPTKRNKTLYDFNVNLLRTTTECMSAVLGGADFVMNMPYDEFYHKTNDFGNRIARNQLLILKNESYLEDKNPADGTYYIEELTKQFSEKALDIFKDIEKGGGFLHQLKEGIIQKKISESAVKEQEQFDREELILVGTNKFRHNEDKMKEELEIYPFLKQKSRKTLIEPILEKRLSEKIEQERLKQE